MTPPPPKNVPSTRPRSASPAERSDAHAAHQQKLKDEAAARRAQAADSPPARKPRPSQRPG